MAGSLVDIVKSRVEKRAQSPLYQAAASGQLPAMSVDPALQQMASEQTAELVRTGVLLPDRAQSFNSDFLKKLREGRANLEDVAYRSSVAIGAPVEPLELGITAGMGLLPMAVSKVPKLWGGKTEPMSIGKSFKLNFGPAFMPASAIFEGLGFAMNPLEDPQYQRGERGYLSSAWKGMQASAERFGERGAEARRRYGLAGIPVQVLHGIMSPLSALGYLGGTVKDMFVGDQAPAYANKAASAVASALDALEKAS